MADPASTLQTLMIVDEGAFLSLQWSFYYVDFPQHFVLKEKQREIISLNDPATLYRNISDIVSVAFDLKINGKSVSPDKILGLSISPNKICTVTMIYRGQPGGLMRLRAPVLQYLPPIAMINYEIVSLGQPARIDTGNLMGHESPFPQVVTYREVNAPGRGTLAVEPALLASFKVGLRTAWINPNWILIMLLLSLVNRPGKVVLPVLAMTGGWILLCFFCSTVSIPIPAELAELLLALVTALLAALAAKRPGNWPLLSGIACCAGLLNGCYDLQQIRTTTAISGLPALIGLSLGFVGSVSSVLLVLSFIVAECKKYPGFSQHWTPRLCWVVAVGALALPVQKFLLP